MKKIDWRIFLAFLALTEGVGALAGWLTREGSALYQAAAAKPPLSPPGWVFGVVWAVLYALMAFSAQRVWTAPASRARTMALGLFFAQLAMNFFWPLIFFNLMWFAPALLWLVALWALALWMTAAFETVDRPAAVLQGPYLIWLAFAVYLNFAAWFLNR